MAHEYADFNTVAEISDTLNTWDVSIKTPSDADFADMTVWERANAESQMRGYEGFYDEQNAYDLEPQHIHDPELRGFYEEQRTRNSNEKPRWVFVCPCCRLMFPRAFCGEKGFRSHIREWLSGTKSCASRPAARQASKRVLRVSGY
jgi:hypothetical protein